MCLTIVEKLRNPTLGVVWCWYLNVSSFIKVVIFTLSQLSLHQHSENNFQNPSLRMLDEFSFLQLFGAKSSKKFICLRWHFTSAIYQDFIQPCWLVLTNRTAIEEVLVPSMKSFKYAQQNYFPAPYTIFIVISSIFAIGSLLIPTTFDKIVV